jgi:proline dehydrogenase
MLSVVRQLQHEGFRATIDLLGETVTCQEQADEACQTYLDILDTLQQEGLTHHGQASATVSIKLTQMGLCLDKQACLERMRRLATRAQECGSFIQIDMEDSSCTDKTIEVYLHLRQAFSNVGIVLQAYLRRTLQDAEHIIRAGEGFGHFRLCKGIYVEPPHLAYQDKGLINRNYIDVLEAMFSQKAYVAIASHDEKLLFEAERLIRHYQLTPEQYEFQMLLGIDPIEKTLLRDAGHPLRVYVPYGREWHRYCMRRIKENPAIVGHLLKNMLT